MEKYYDLIASLVKSHRKYKGCESILDDIVQDVYSHAEVVLRTVTNESVVTSYLNKIVSTSMITVPKKLGINSKRGETPAVFEVIQTPENSVSAESEPDLSLENVKTEESAYNEEPDSGFEEIESETMDETLEISDSDEYLNENDGYNSEPDVNMELVDKMINGVTDTEIADSADLQEISGAEDNMELAFEDELDESVVIVDNTEILELSKEDELTDETSIEQTEMSDLSADTEGNLTLDDSEDDGLLLEEKEDNSAYILEETSVEETVESEISKEDTSDTNLSIYGRFNYTPEVKNANDDEVISEINALDKKNPDKHIKDICILKYEKMLSISEIAKELGISEDDVLESLNEIIYTIKD